MRWKMISVIILSFCLLVCPLVYAQEQLWQLKSVYGEWISTNRLSWKSQTINTEGNFTYKLNLSYPLTYWHIRAEGTIVYSTVSSYWHGLIFRVYGGNEDYIEVYVVWSCIWVYQMNVMQIRTYIYVSNPQNHSETTIRIYVESFHPILVCFDRITNETLQIRGAIYDNKESEQAITSFNENHTLPIEFFNNMHLSQTVVKWWSNSNYRIEGQIYFEDLKYTGELSSGQTPIPTMSWWEKLAWDFWNVLSGTASEIQIRLKPYAEFFGWLGRHVSYWFQVAGSIIVRFVEIGLPLFPFFVLFWFIDALTTSIYEGSFEPVGYVMITIYDFIRGVVQTIANILSTIWDYITFWS